MRVDREVDLLERQAVLDGERRLGDQVGRARPDDVRAQQLARLGIGDHLDESLCLAERQGAARRREGKLADLHGDALFLGLFLAEADVGDLRVRVHAVRRRVIVGDAVAVSGDVLDRAHAFVGGDVGEHDPADHVADRPHAIRARAQVVIHHDPAAVQLDAGLLRVEPLRVGSAADRKQDLVRVDRAALAAGREAHLQSAVAFDDLGDLAVGVDLATDFAQVLGVDRDQVGVDHREHLGQHLEHRHLAAEGGKHRCELHAHHAAADHREPARHLLQLEDLVGVDRELGSGQRDSRDGGPGRDHDVLGLQAIAGNLDHTFAREASAAFEGRDAACFEQALNAFDQLVDDGALSLLGGGPVEADVVGDEPERRSVPGHRVELGRLEQSLGRDAAPDQACAAHPVLLHDGGPGAELGGAQSGDVAPRATADHD